MSDCLNIINSYNLDFINSNETGDIIDDYGSIYLENIYIVIDLLLDIEGNFVIWISSDCWIQDIYFRWHGGSADFEEWLSKVCNIYRTKDAECRFLEDFMIFAESITSYKTRKNRIAHIYNLK